MKLSEVLQGSYNTVYGNPVEQHLSRKTIHSRGEEVSRVTSEANSIRAIRDSAHPPPPISVSDLGSGFNFSRKYGPYITIPYEVSVLGFRPWV